MTMVVMFMGVTVTVAVEVTPWSETVIVAVPVAMPVTSPPGEVTVAIVSSEVDQPTELPWIVFEVPSEYLAVAPSWTVPPMAIVADGGVMKIELIEGLTKKPPQAAIGRQTRTATTVLRLERSLAVKGRVSLGFITTPEVKPALSAEVSS
jgi:hypothetical protein